MVLTPVHDDLLFVVQRTEELVTDGEVGIVDIAHDGRDLGSAAFLVNNVG